MTFNAIVCILFIAGYRINQCQGQLNDGHYDEEDDAKVLPIVLPIVLIIAFVCIFACCWQGKKCPCNKSKDENENKPEKSDSKTGDTMIIANEKQIVKANLSKPQKPPSLPSYASVTTARNTPLPGHRTSAEYHNNRTRVNDYAPPTAQNRPRNAGYKREESHRYRSHGSESGRSHSSYSHNNMNRQPRHQSDEYSTNSRREQPGKVTR